jgi:hypothetical protein
VLLQRAELIARKLVNATGIHPGVFDAISSGLIQAKTEFIVASLVEARIAKKFLRCDFLICNPYMR